MPCYSWAVDCDIGGRKKHRIKHNSGHDGIQELIWGVWICLLLLLLPVCVWLKKTKTKRCQTLSVSTCCKDTENNIICYLSQTASKINDTFILSARSPKATIMSPGLFIFFSTRTVWEKSVGEYDRPSFGTVAQKFSSSLPSTEPRTEKRMV